MDHYLVQSIEKALGWTGTNGLGVAFARGGVSDLDLCSRLLTPWKLLDVIMRRSLAPPQLRCFQKGIELHPDAYITQQVTRRGQTLPVANMDRLGQFLRSGCTVVLDALDSFDPTMEIACRALQWWSREVVQVNTYLTTNDAAGFSLHWDDHDVVIIQIAGEKSWEVRGASRPVPMYRDAEPNQEPSEDIVWSGTMRTGDVMHIPRGYWHQATRTGRGAGYSLHVTFGFVKRTGVDWLTWVADRSRERELFRRDIARWDTLARRPSRNTDSWMACRGCWPTTRSRCTWWRVSRNGRHPGTWRPAVYSAHRARSCVWRTFRRASSSTRRPWTCSQSGRRSPSRCGPCPRCGCCWPGTRSRWWR